MNKVNLKRVWVEARPFCAYYKKYTEHEVDKVTGKKIKTNKVSVEVETTWITGISVVGMVLATYYTSKLLPFLLP